MTLVCPTCGHSVRAQSVFCPQCGRRLDGRLLPNTELNGKNYRIVRSISKGGMGAVYLAEDRHAFDRLCIVKQMLEYYDTADSDDKVKAQERFQDEGRVLAALSHPGIPQIYAFFQEHGRYYIVMEYIRGDNLETFLTHTNRQDQVINPKRRLPQEEVIRYTIQVCRILEYLHAQTRPVTHQDVKPANLILEAQLGEVRLVDFGTARARIAKGNKPGNGKDTSVYGTDGYAPPEQYRGKPVTKSDVFALAATTYHLLTDDDPRDHPFKWPKLNQLSKELAQALTKALRENPIERSSAADLRHDLEAMIMPSRTLQTFTFPGGVRIRSVGTLPALCDDNWDAARGFLYNGDFERWLRDINRLDLVMTAKDIVEQDDNHDAGLERFLRTIDPGLPRPKVKLDQDALDLGGIARESAHLRRVTALNTTRGYTSCKISATEPWIELYPETLHCWAAIPQDIRVNIRAEDLPFRSQQHGEVIIEPVGQDPLRVPVTAHVSLIREVWRIIKRALSAAFPESWNLTKQAWALIRRVTRAINKPFHGRAWLAFLIWAFLSAGIGLLIYYMPEGTWLQLGYASMQAPLVWSDYVVPCGAGPPVIFVGLWLLFAVVSLLGGAIGGFFKGMIKSFTK